MSKHLLWRLSLVAVIALSAGACSGEQAADTGDQGSANAEAEAHVGTGPSAIGAGDESGSLPANTAVPQMSSGTMPPLITEEAPETPVPVSDRRVVNIAEAMDTVPFTVLEPHDLPEDSHRDIVFVEEPLVDGPTTGLPAVRMVYSIQPSGMITVVQSPATGEPADGEAIDINGTPGWIVDDTAVVIVWEADGVRYEVRGNVAREIVEKAARSLGEVIDMEVLP